MHTQFPNRIRFISSTVGLRQTNTILMSLMYLQSHKMRNKQTTDAMVLSVFHPTIGILWEYYIVETRESVYGRAEIEPTFFGSLHQWINHYTTPPDALVGISTWLWMQIATSFPLQRLYARTVFLPPGYSAGRRIHPKLFNTATYKCNFKRWDGLSMLFRIFLNFDSPEMQRRCRVEGFTEFLSPEKNSRPTNSRPCASSHYSSILTSVVSHPCPCGESV